MKIIKEYLNNKKTWLIIFLLYAPFMYSMNFMNGSIELLDNFFNILRPISATTLLIWFIFIAKRKPSKLTITIFIMELWQLTVTIFTTKKIVVAIYDAAASVAIPLLIELFIDYKKDLIDAMMFHHEIAIYPNLITLLLYFGQNGRNGNGFFYLGDYTILYEFYLPAIAIATVYIELTKKKIRGLILIVVSLISCFMSPSATTKISTLTFMFVYLYCRFIKRKDDISISALFGLSLIANYSITFMFVGGNMPLVDMIITDVLHKNTTMSGRTMIWPKDIELIKQNLIFGHGYRTTVKLDSGFEALHAHNALLDKLLVGGIVQLVLFLLIHVILCVKTEKTKPSRSKVVLIGLMTAIFISYITDQLFKFWRFYVIFTLLYHLDELLDKKETNI